MPLKEFLIKKLSLSLMIPEYVIKEVVAFQATETLKATNDRNSIEWTGFGKIIFNEKKAVKKLESYRVILSAYMKELDQDITPARKNNLDKRMITLTRNIEHLESKLKVEKNGSE